MSRWLISTDDWIKHGCPTCGCCCGDVFLSISNAKLWICDFCNKESIVQKENDIRKLSCLANGFDIKNAFGEHPRQRSICDGFNSCVGTVEVNGTGKYIVPCFVSGGKSAKYNCLVLKARCKIVAQNLFKLIGVGIIIDNVYLIVGARDEYQLNLNQLMLGIVRTGRLDGADILQMQQTKFSQNNLYHFN